MIQIFENSYTTLSHIVFFSSFIHLLLFYIIVLLVGILVYCIHLCLGEMQNFLALEQHMEHTRCWVNISLIIEWNNLGFPRLVDLSLRNWIYLISYLLFSCFLNLIGWHWLIKLYVLGLQFYNTSSVYCAFKTPSQTSFHHHLTPLYKPPSTFSHPIIPPAIHPVASWSSASKEHWVLFHLALDIQFPFTSQIFPNSSPAALPPTSHSILSVPLKAVLSRPEVLRPWKFILCYVPFLFLFKIYFIDYAIRVVPFVPPLFPSTLHPPPTIIPHPP